MNICIFGDSIAWGACDFEKGGWVERLKVHLMENREDICVYNLGVSGDNTDDLLKRFSKEAKAREADMVIFAVGTNDSQYITTKKSARIEPEKFKINISRLIKEARKLTEKIMFIGLTKVDESKTMPIPWDTDKYYSNQNIQQYNVILEKFCAEERVGFIDTFDLLDDSDLEDGLHPNSDGHVKIFEKIREVIKNLII